MCKFTHSIPALECVVYNLSLLLTYIHVWEAGSVDLEAGVNN